MSIKRTYPVAMGRDLELCRKAASMVNPSRIEESARRLVFQPDGRIRNRFLAHPQCLEASQYVHDSLKASLKFGTAVKQGTEAIVTGENFELRYTLENIIAGIDGKKDNNRNIMVLSYYDSSPKRPDRWYPLPPALEGAYDNVFGTAVMLELARVFGELERESLGFDLQFIGMVNKGVKLPDGSLLANSGCRRFVEDHIKNFASYFNKTNTAIILDIAGHQAGSPKGDYLRASALMRYPTLTDALIGINRNEAGEEFRLEKRNVSFISRMISDARFDPLNQFGDIDSPACLITESNKGPRHLPADSIDQLNFSLMAKLARLLALSFAFLGHK